MTMCRSRSASVVDAVRCAVEVQHGMIERSAEMAAEQRIEFRLGINLGDIIIIDGDDIYGDGVNVAARLGGLAERFEHRLFLSATPTRS